ncbi:COP9 signalosome complex subunit 3 isoform X2 [Tribolium castaneum]|uniref:COP9 signalosome complex subunit 3 n=1 Tax=Tribolium castaneum TaxID=7070 RepID=D6W6D8_TRICA|nr:PREDICTED: COP9 signalosome complex subunit 3 [Tribolium castaneum]EFA11362.1 COP9 signalosome complex subunit 3-like Protein [Tribolium castaneum]|eukprot:XP_970761.1 PREDICTED: COP9 signalosome complex subunit 3 [Tribolium castaneum]
MASVLEQFVTTVRTLSSHGNYKVLCEYLSKSSDILLKNTQHLDNVLETLDLQQHSLGYLVVLCAKFNSTVPANTPDNRFAQVQEFIHGCNGEQIRLAPDTFAELCHSLTNYLVEQKQPMKGILLLRKAISKLRFFDSQLTSIHADLCQLCLLAKCFKPALEILDTDITGICQEIVHNPNGAQFEAKYFLLYYYYGGMIYLAVRNLDRALYFFEVAITTPAHAVSHIMLEAYKKYIIVSLLLHGKIQPVPKYASQVVTRFIKPLSQPYNDLANSFTSNNTADLNAVLNKHREAFTRDHNLGLVKQVSSVLYKKNIQRLTKTFLTLSLSDVASRVGLPGPSDAERYILHMIEDQQIYATINQKDGMVVFRDEPEKYGGPDVLKSLEAQLAICMELDKQILAMDEDIQVNPVYVKKSSGVQDEEQPSKSTYAM